MVSSVLSSLVCVLCVILLPPVWAFSCHSYWDNNGDHHDSEECFSSYYCCGSCTKRYCCKKVSLVLTQELCPDRFLIKSRTVLIILGSIMTILFCVGLIVCCVAPCCLFYKKCRKGRKRGRQAVGHVATVVSTPLQPLPHTTPQPTHPGYQFVPAQPGFRGQPNPTGAAGSYVAPTAPPAFSAGEPPSLYPSSAYAPPPYNPVYVPNY